MNFIFVNGSNKHYEVFTDSIKYEGEFISFTALAWLSETEKHVHKINLSNVVSIDYYNDIIELCSNIQPEQEKNNCVVGNKYECESLNIIIYITVCIAFGLSVFNLINH